MWLEGWQAIREHTGRAQRTLHRWRRRYGLPVCNLPNGRVATSTELLDQWLIERAYRQAEAKVSANASSVASQAPQETEQTEGGAQ